MRRQAIVAFGIGAALGMTACGSSASSSGSSGRPAGSGHTLLIGAVISQTGPGAVIGPSQKNGIALAQDAINGQGGVNGATIDVKVVDDGSDKAQSAQQFQTLIQQSKVLGIIGPTLSSDAVAADPVADAAHTPVVAISNVGNGIVGHCAYDCVFIFRDSLGEATAIPANVRQAVQLHSPKTAVIMYANDDKFSSDGEGIFKQSLAANSVQLLDEIPFSKNETAFDSFVTKMKGDNPDILVLSSLGTAPAKIMVEARRQGYTGPIIGGNGFNSKTVSRQAGAAAKDAQSASAYFAGNSNNANTDFVAAYQARFGQRPDQPAAQAYTGLLIFAAAARSAHLTYGDLAADRQSLRDALEKVQLDDTPLGPFRFTSQHDVSQPIYIVAMDGAGGYTLVATVPKS